ncbi:DUF2975 domain-containing protein [Vibrio proteolyticus]|uniref:DUF2975 domain-containing protein n=1 Tax=Vibrio proteolyticus NBRC 13287 TaxID=1219065 RepID=U3A0M5_VIBPR|nr:DUF2975 domain-containing protein [Vibrio proteolyticus]GAD66882.1 hypothetical protein VPR01S_05_01770 [Vibrio proteolyticus NBRC 13287]
MNKIQTQSRRIRQFFQFFLIVTPIAVCYYWLTVGTTYDVLTRFGIVELSYDFSEYTQQPLTAMTRLFAAGASLLLCAILMYALSVLIRLFRNYEHHEIFTLDNAICYQKLGRCLFYWVGGSIIHGALISVILSFNNPPGERMVTLSFQGLDFLTLVLGVIILIISWVMREGHDLADESRLTI